MAASQRRIIIYAGSFNPPAIHHLRIAEALSAIADAVVIFPCGSRSDKPSIDAVLPAHRMAMILPTFQGVPNVDFDWSDIASGRFMRTIEVDRYFRRKFGVSVIHAVGTDLIVGGASGLSEIQKSWHRGEEVWQHLRFAVITRQDYPIVREDLPPHGEIVDVAASGSSSEIRRRVAESRSIKGLVIPAVEKYIVRNRLYQADLKERRSSCA